MEPALSGEVTPDLHRLVTPGSQGSGTPLAELV